MRTWILIALLTLAACPSPPGAGDDEIDAGAGGDTSARETTVSCAPEPDPFVVRAPDGSTSSTVYYVASLDQPFDWSAVSWRLCNPMVETPAAECPGGATCSGTPHTVGYCTSGRGIEQVDSGAGSGRLNCGIVIVRVSPAGITTRSGTHWQFATIRID